MNESHLAGLWRAALIAVVLSIGGPLAAQQQDAERAPLPARPLVAAATPASEAPGTPGDTPGPSSGAAESRAASPGAQEETPDDMVLNPAQPEFTMINLPTTLRLPKHKLAFRVTHRFTRDLTEGSFGSLLADFFGFDGGAQIGLELRFAIMSGWQAGIYRTSDRTIELFTQYNVLRQGPRSPVSVDGLATFEGTNNLHHDDPNQPTGEAVRSPALGAVVSRVLGRFASVNATIAWVNNTNPLPSELVDHNDTVIAGIGARVRVRPTVYVVAEIVPRIAGDTPNTTLASFGLEKRVGGHGFQVNFSNGFGTTMAQIARGGATAGHWFIGFNINRKFY